MSLHTHVLPTEIGRPRNLEAALQQALKGPRELVLTMDTFIGHLQMESVVAGFDASDEEIEATLRRLHAAGLIRLGQFVQQSGRHRGREQQIASPYRRSA